MILLEDWTIQHPERETLSRDTQKEENIAVQAWLDPDTLSPGLDSSRVLRSALCDPVSWARSAAASSAVKNRPFGPRGRRRA